MGDTSGIGAAYLSRAHVHIVVYCKVESIVKSRVGYFAYSLDDVVASTCPVTVKQ